MLLICCVYWCGGIERWSIYYVLLLHLEGFSNWEIWELALISLLSSPIHRVRPFKYCPAHMHSWPALLTIWTESLLSQSQISPSVHLHILKWLRPHHGSWFIPCFSIYPGWARPWLLGAPSPLLPSPCWSCIASLSLGLLTFPPHPVKQQAPFTLLWCHLHQLLCLCIFIGCTLCMLETVEFRLK